MCPGHWGVIVIVPLSVYVRACVCTGVNVVSPSFLGKKVDGNNVGAVHVIMKRKYRQYMNRKGGFNRPLDFVN